MPPSRLRDEAEGIIILRSPMDGDEMEGHMPSTEGASGASQMSPAL